MLLAGYCLLSRRILRRSNRHSESHPYKHSSFPRKRESLCGGSVRTPGRYCRRPPPDSRFRGNDEVLLAGYCLLSRRTLRRSDRHGESHPYKHSSFPRKRESLCGGSVRTPGRYCGRPPPDSRFRGNDDVLSYGYCLPLRHFFGVPTVVMRADGFFHTLFAGMTKCYSMVIVFYKAVTSAIRLLRSETPDFFARSFAEQVCRNDDKPARIEAPVHPVDAP